MRGGVPQVGEHRSVLDLYHRIQKKGVDRAITL